MIPRSILTALGLAEAATEEKALAAIAEMKAKGMQINDVAPQERARMRDAVKPVVEKYTAVIGADLVKQAYAEIERVRKQP